MRPITPRSSAKTAADGWKTVDRLRLQAEGSQFSPDGVVLEEALEIRVHGFPLAVLMRTPGRERDLVAGWLVSEGILQDCDDWVAVEACPVPEGQVAGSAWNVSLADGVSFDPRSRRFSAASSSCGVCGASSLEDLQLRLPSERAASRNWSLDELLVGFAAMREQQVLFAETGGAHAAGLLTADGRLLDLAEDVGRHNATDKVFGARFLQGDWPLSTPTALLASGRISWEIVQKAVVSGVSAIAGLGASTSLALAAAQEANIEIYAFVGQQGANHYPVTKAMPRGPGSPAQATSSSEM